jgi:predicted AlkP superfamily pyrophosphatase or phosphodiesterase
MNRSFNTRLGVLLLCVFLLSLPASLSARKRYVIIVSLDGFRWDYPQMYNTPNLNRMASEGVSTAMLPSYPASTFPNHYTLATGLVPDHNGIVNNSFWNREKGEFYSMGGTNRDNPAYYLGEPIWLTAQRQGVKSGIVYWVASDVAVLNQRPTYYKDYSQRPLISYPARVDSIMALLSKPKKERPRLLMLYYDEPDHTAHGNGPVSDQTREAVAQVDSMVGILLDKVAASRFRKKTDIIVLADHGMTAISPDRVVRPSDYIKEEWCDEILTGVPTMIYSKPEYRDSIYNAFKKAPHVNVWKKEEIPSELHYGTSARIGDILVAPDLGWQISDHPRNGKGAHGYFPQDKDMQAIFRAVGPDFRKNYKAEQFRNVDIYPLLAYLLGITPSPNDGDLDEVRNMLR